MGFDHHAILHLRGPSKQHPRWPLTLWAPSILRDHAARWQGSLDGSPDLFVAEPSLVLGPTQNQQIIRPLNKWVRITRPDGEHVASQTHRGSLEALCLPHRQEVSGEATSPSLWKEYSNMPKLLNSWNSHQSGKPLRFRRVYSPPSDMQTSRQYTLFARCSPQNVIDTTNQHVALCKGKTKSLLMTGPHS